ncbi:hypothetical protein [Dokdonella immobilis]|uniref:hypothetical protein n=1 Tax=Dokdonella immobilis TaxID=578942 RepID=UPI000B894629|nr:hypothetical protein [Dokdonella immobilis]
MGNTIGIHSGTRTDSRLRHRVETEVAWLAMVDCNRPVISKPPARVSSPGAASVVGAVAFADPILVDGFAQPSFPRFPDTRIGRRDDASINLHADASVATRPEDRCRDGFRIRMEACLRIGMATKAAVVAGQHMDPGKNEIAPDDD